MSIVNAVEGLRKPGDFGYRQAGAVYLGTQEECVFARDPNEHPSRSPIDIGGNCLLGQRPDLEATIKTELMATSDLRTLRLVKDPLNPRLKPLVIEGWDGSSGDLVLSNKRVYQLFHSAYTTDGGISRGHFLLQEVAWESVRLVDNRLGFVNLDNELSLELWETPVSLYQLGRKKLMVPQKWGGTVAIEGTNPGGLMTNVLDVINKTVSERHIPVWRKNRI
ncbi:MAG TPA: hypothetical protein VMR59_00625 [Patescibacteria group bacterium]|nr:hypothetical protein [Patescibacteria group bacterium]